MSLVLGKAGNIGVANRGVCLRRASAFLPATPANRYAASARISREMHVRKSRNETSAAYLEQ